MKKKIRVLIVDDHEMVREGLRALLEDEPEMSVVGEARDGVEAVAEAVRLSPDVILMDLVMPNMDGIEAIRGIRKASPASRILVLTSFADPRHVQGAIQAGALGYLLKDLERAELSRAIRAAAKGEPTLHPEAQKQLLEQVSGPGGGFSRPTLTPRESDVLRLIAKGMSNKEIGSSLDLTEGTVKGYVSAVLEKLGVADRTQAALFALKHGMD
jgi:DNA-binding NarL/FixJ family response regulator